jgi:REP element-mobilizing transposase RayT
MSYPAAYFITFSCYGSHLHGAEPGSVDRNHSLPGSPFVPPDPARLQAAEARMNKASYVLDARGRGIVLQSIQGVCTHRGWTLIAAHVRVNHVHVVVAADAIPEAAMHDFKAYAARLLNASQPAVKRWTRHGSTQYLWKDEDVDRAVHYVVAERGEPMAVFGASAVAHANAMSRYPESCTCGGHDRSFSSLSLPSSAASARPTTRV